MTLLSRLLGAVCLALPLIAPLASGAEQSCTEDAMIVFDGSGSMAEMGYNAIGEPRIIEARDAMRRVIPAVSKVRRLGLVIYGPSGDQTCDNSDLRFAPQWQSGARIIADVEALDPAGGTSLTESVRIAAQALDYTSKPGTVVLVTDGKETCGGAPCQLAAEMAANAPGLTVHVIGFKVRGRHFDWADANAPAVTVARCLADRTGGQYVRAESLNELIVALRVTLGCNVVGALSSDPLAIRR